MNYCPNATKTTINYLTNEGIKSQIIIPQGDVDIECNDAPKTGRYIFTVKDGGYNLDCSPQHEITYYTNVFIANSYIAGAGTSPYANLAACNWTKLTFYTDNAVSATQNFPSAHQVNQANNPDYSPGGKALIIKNSAGNQLLKVNAKDCNFNVACDDDCPSGYQKCTHNKYPGYCCLPCKGTGDRLNNLANIVGR